jgi:hypothetical protein
MVEPISYLAVPEVFDGIDVPVEHKCVHGCRGSGAMPVQAQKALPRHCGDASLGEFQFRDG